MVAGILYIGIQAVHPPDRLSSVGTDAWLVVAGLSLVMSLLILIGVTGIYVRQVDDSGWLGLIGYVLFSLFWVVSISFGFMEAFVLPPLTATAPAFVEGVVGIFGGGQSEADLGMLPIVAPLAGALYILGGLLLGIATVRAEVLPRLAGALLAAGAVVTVAGVVIPHPLDRALAIPVGLALIWLGYAVWSERETGIGTERSSTRETASKQ
jgi:hypothetical protein